MKKFLKKHLVEIILFVILLVGLCLILYPTVSDWWNSFHQTRAIASYVEDVENTSEEERQAMLEAARVYNDMLARVGNSFILSEEEEAEYNALLDVSGTGIMGYIQIPAINVYLPIYHGTDEAILQIAVGHIAGSSLPIGGRSTHSLLSGHRGLPSAKLFTDLDQVVEGDVFLINVLNETYTYQVDQIRIVLPEEVEELAIEEGKDYCTLITCTPYGVNTHRILVRGHRIENAAGDLTITKEAVKIPVSIVMLAIGIPLLFMVLAVLLIYYRVKQPKKSQKEILEDLRKR
ncbi:MAG: class C sortase [Lachnospiraceae bacterium]|jgi:sortase A|nr:class C sortase [Lachnospiraceae bacterium]